MKHLLIDRKITKCEECNYLHFEDDGYWCYCDFPSHTHNTHDELYDSLNTIPDWCPLPDVKEEVKNVLEQEGQKD